MQTKQICLFFMNNKIDILKGLHPGAFLQHELNKQKLKSGKFAESIGEHPQTLSAIIRGKRSVNTPLSLRIEKALNLEEGILMVLQVYYDIAQEKQKVSKQRHPDLTKLRPILFWDTSLEKIDFYIHSQYVINRVFERGTDEEIKEIIQFYGAEIILQQIRIEQKSPFYTNIKIQLKKHLDYEV